MAEIDRMLQANEEWERSFTGNTDRAPLDEAPDPKAPPPADR